MNKTIALTAVIAALAGGAVVAQTSRAADASGPQSIAEVHEADAGDHVRVMSRHMAPDAVQPRQQATVIGRMEHGRMQAREIVRDDGTPAPRDAEAKPEQHDSRRDRHEAQRGGHESRHGQGGHHGPASRSQPRQQEHRSH